MGSIEKRHGVLERVIRQPFTMVALGWVLLLAVLAVFSPYLAPYDPNVTDVLNRLRGPSVTHWLGTDDLGRDTLSRAMWGSRVAVLACLQAVGLAALIGIPIGLLVGYKGGRWDRIVMRLVEVEQSIPLLLIAFALVAILGYGLFNAMLAVSIAFSMSYLRITRAVVLAERPKSYVQAAEIQGYPISRVLFRHILPNIVGPLIVQTSILSGVAILLEAMMSFLGIGTQAGTASWGAMLEDARRFQVQQLFLSLVPGLMITVTVLAFNIIGDGLRDAFGIETHARKSVSKSRAVRPALRIQAMGKEQAEAQRPSVLSVTNLEVEFPQQDGSVSHVVKGVSFDVAPAEIFGLVGESGSGKSMTVSAVLGMVPPPGEVTGGSIVLDGRELVGISAAEWKKIRGRDIGVVFQDPMAALSQVHTVGMQITEGLRYHQKMTKAQAWARAAELLDIVGVPNARARLDDYPHQFSGGMAQRAMIAAALSCNPKLLIADEPTTALDVTVQKQVLELLLKLREQLRMSVLLITHDLGVVAEVCDRVAVMQHGVLVDYGNMKDVFVEPKHSYTKQLLLARDGMLGANPRRSS
ncbi:peptide/nickel transport system permease protein [Neorhizobium galegae]|uniref:dipeptide/oligopeptide/nickel ABC transporter permease/ATP-binding protein n=1 Tax=Neorhizobium galegae TaxID=399 RepID=UPI0027811213|nr:dipeptide/oligopeptide/nickel ABC transporter permease/ATP-binding protein [Neorhizobium galegae]MDQ0137763.1 peptide/nickel transport system permease protein [Neorhizobium galegae]